MTSHHLAHSSPGSRPSPRNSGNPLENRPTRPPLVRDLIHMSVAVTEGEQHIFSKIDMAIILSGSYSSGPPGCLPEPDRIPCHFIVDLQITPSTCSPVSSRNTGSQRTNFHLIFATLLILTHPHHPPTTSLGQPRVRPDPHSGPCVQILGSSTSTFRLGIHGRGMTSHISY